MGLVTGRRFRYNKAMAKKPLRVVFVCVGNSCRSQMAEAFARHLGGGQVEACSAGSHPRGRVDPTTIVVMREKGLDLGTSTSKGLLALPQRTWDAVIGMGCGDEACAVVPAKQHLTWQIPDPVGQSLEVYRQVRDLIEQSVKLLIEQLFKRL